MEIKQKDVFTVLVPTEKEFLCSIEDKERFDAETEEQGEKDEQDREEITPIYKFKEVYVPKNATVQAYVNIFMEID